MDLTKYWKQKAEKSKMSVEELKQYCDASLLIWSETHRMLFGEPFSLVEYPYLEDIYADTAEEIIVLKSAQSGLSEWLVSTMLWFVDSNKGNTYFAFPTMADCSVFVQGRVNTATEETDYLASHLKGKTDNVKIKRYGYRNMYFTGSRERKQVLSSPADIILEDEYDEHNVGVHDLIEKRLNNSKWKWKRRISTPTVPGFGIHKKWMESDQRCWYVKCPYCKREIRVSGDDFGDRWQKMIGDGPNGKIYVCPECKSPEFNPSSELGYWKATYPERPIHGYSINITMPRRCTAQELLDKYERAVREDTVDEFYRSDLGCPYQPEGSRIYPKDVHACAEENPYFTLTRGIDGHDYFFGVDTGKNKHVVVLEAVEDMLKIVFATVVKEYSDIPPLFELFKPKGCVIDNKPEPFAVSELHKVYDFVYAADHNNSIMRASELGREDGMVWYNRYYAIERLYNKILKHAIQIPIDLNTITNGEYYDHLCTQMRIIEKKEDGARVYRYISTSTSNKKLPDHYMSATLFALTAYDVYKTIKKQHKTTESGLLIL
jgi:hypothetical protein